MKNFHYLIFILFSFQALYAQNKPLTKEEIDKQYYDVELVYPDSDEDVKKIEALIESSKKINHKQGIITGKIKMLFILKERSDYKKMLELIREMEVLGLERNLDIANLYFYKAIANKELGIEKEALHNLQDALKYARLIENPDSRHMVTSNMYNAIAYYYESNSPDSMGYYQKKELEELEQVSDKDTSLKVIKYRSIALNKINTGMFYVNVHKPQRLDMAEPYFTEVYNYRTTQPDVFEDMDMPILCGVGEFYLAKKDYQKSIDHFKEVLQREKRKKNPFYRSHAYSALADAYEGFNIPQEQAKYTKLYAALNDSLNKAAKKEVNQQFEKLVTAAEKKKKEEYNSNIKTLLTITSCFIVLLALFIWLYWRRKSRVAYKRYEELVAKINTENEPQNDLEMPEEATESNEMKPVVNITDETTKILLQKLEKFEKSQKYLRKDISRPWMANHLGTNNTYLTEIIKIQYDTNYTNYINRLRIDYITRKLITNPTYREYKIEYLAEECGYGSRQVFISAFKKETGFTPSYFIENLKKDDAVGKIID